MITLATVLGSAVPAAGAIIAAATFRMNRWTVIETRRAQHSEVAFVDTRQKLKSRLPQLQELAREAQQEYLLMDGVPLLVQPEWVPEHPLDLGHVHLRWWPQTSGGEAARRQFESAIGRTRHYWPGSPRRTSTYHEVIGRLEQPNPDLFFDGASFRLMNVDARPGEISLAFEPGWYFDALDTTNVLAYETALSTVEHGRRFRRARPLDGPYRRWLGSPFDLERRCAIPGVSTLTVRNGATGPTFILHERNAAAVAQAQGVTHVTPAGEFQPKDLSLTAGRDDLDLWSNMVREYAEELLGIEHARGQPVSPSEDGRLRTAGNLLHQAYDSGSVTVRFLGIGLDPLTWKPEILMVAVFDENAFDRIFSGIVARNDEGTLVFAGDRTRSGIPFTEEEVRFRIGRPMLTAGRACLARAWATRTDLGL